MSTTFDRAYGLIRKLEGGFVDNPNDPGGATFAGITQATWDRYCTDHNIVPFSVSTLKDPDIYNFYFEYWHTFRCDSIAQMPGDELLAREIAVVFFQFAVNAGKQATRILQVLLKVSADGIIGEKTIQALVNSKIIPEDLLFEQLNYYTALKTWKDFSYIWTRRVIETKNYIG